MYSFLYVTHWLNYGFCLPIAIKFIVGAQIVNSNRNTVVSILIVNNKISYFMNAVELRYSNHLRDDTLPKTIMEFIIFYDTFNIVQIQ